MDYNLSCLRSCVRDRVSCDRCRAFPLVEMEFRQCVCFPSENAFENFDDNTDHPWQDAFSEGKQTHWWNSMMSDWWLMFLLGLVSSSEVWGSVWTNGPFFPNSSTQLFYHMPQSMLTNAFFPQQEMFMPYASRQLEANSWNTTFLKSVQTRVAMDQAVVRRLRELGHNISELEELSPGKAPRKNSDAQEFLGRAVHLRQQGRKEPPSMQQMQLVNNSAWLEKTFRTYVFGFSLEGLCSRVLFVLGDGVQHLFPYICIKEVPKCVFLVKKIASIAFSTTQWTDIFHVLSRLPPPAPEQESEYRRLHNVNTRAELTQAAKDFLEVNRKQGNRTNPCSSPLGQEEIMSLAHRGVEAGISRAKFEHWVPFNFVAAPEDQPVLASRGSAEFSQREALRRHTLAVVCSGIGMQTTSKSEDSCGCVFVPS